jgi:hypothetical protein
MNDDPGRRSTARAMEVMTAMFAETSSTQSALQRVAG